MTARVFAGRFAFSERDGAPSRRDLIAALRRDGPAAGAERGAFAVAWTPPTSAPEMGEGMFCVIDGRIGTARLAQELSADPASSPEHIVAEGYARFGEDVLQRLRGEFAIAVWDSERETGMLARDRLGMRPIFVAEDGPDLLFASEIRNLLALLPRRPRPDSEAMAQWLARHSSIDPRTLYSGIERLLPAHVIRFGADGIRRARYWHPRYSDPEPLAEEEAVRRVRAALHDAVARSLATAENPGVLLSGGLDSGAVAALAGPQVRAYSAVFPDDPLVDESAEIGRVRDWVGIDGVEARFHSGSALAGAAEFLREWEVPSVSPNVFVWLPLLRQAASDGVDVLLDGEGGDELFGCAQYLVADRLRSGRLLAARRAARQLPGMGDRPPRVRLRRALVEYGVRGALPYGLHERLRRVRARHRPGADPWVWKRTRAPRWWAHLAHALTTVGDALGAPDHLRRVGRLAGVERRHPLRDETLVDLALRLPPELAFDPVLDRPLARRALAGALPPEQLESERKPVFNSLLERALEGPDAAVLRDLLEHPHPELARRLRKHALDDLVAARERPFTWALDLWRVATLGLWLEHQVDPDVTLRVLGSDKRATDVHFRTVPVFSRQP